MISRLCSETFTVLPYAVGTVSTLNRGLPRVSATKGVDKQLHMQLHVCGYQLLPRS